MATGADLLVWDAQYTPEEYPSKVGWGHSTYESGTAVATAAGVNTLLLAHHDPLRTDTDVTQIETKAQQVFAHAAAAREGPSHELNRRGKPLSLKAS